MTYNEYIDSIIQTRGQWGVDTSKYWEGLYDCRIELVNDLNKMGIPISDSTIRQIQKNEYGTCIKNKFQYVIDNLSWKMKEKYVGLREDMYA